MSPAVAWALANPEATMLALVVLGYALVNVAKFRQPTSPLGQAILRFLIQITVFSLKAWGLKNPKVPFTLSATEVEQELRDLDTVSTKPDDKETPP